MTQNKKKSHLQDNLQRLKFPQNTPTPQDILHVKIFNLHTPHFYFSFTFVKYHFLPFIWHFPTNKKKKFSEIE